MKWRDEISAAIHAAFKPELERQLAELRQYVDGEFAAIHAHLDAATETLAETDTVPGELTPDQRTGLHAIRAQVGAKHNPPPPSVVANERCPACGKPNGADIDSTGNWKCQCGAKGLAIRDYVADAAAMSETGKITRDAAIAQGLIREMPDPEAEQRNQSLHDQLQSLKGKVDELDA